MDTPLPKAEPTYPTLASTKHLTCWHVIYDAVPMALCLIDPQLRFLSSNRRMAEILAHYPQDVVGRSLSEVVPGIAAQLEPHLRQTLSGERVTDLELRGTEVGATCEGRTFLVSLEPLRETTGEIQGVLCSALDITERRRAEEALRESEDHYRHTVELSPHIPWTAEPDGVTVGASSRWLALTGSTEAGGKGWANSVHPDDLAGASAAWFRSLENGEPYDFEYRLRMADGNYRWVRSRAAPRHDSQGRILRWYGTVEDVHHRKLAEVALRESEQRLARAIAAARFAAWEFDLVSGDIHASPGFSALFGLPANTLRTLAAALDAIHPDDRCKVRSMIEQSVLAKGGVDHQVEFRVVVHDGAVRWLRGQGRTECGTDGQPRRMVGVTQDVTAQRLAEQRVSHLAHHDPLTGLANRRLFLQRLEDALARRCQEGQLALHYLDLDQFKAVNDTLGHPAGDRLLLEVAGRLRAEIADDGFIARLGGDEFAIIHTGFRGDEEAAAFARRVLNVFGDAFDLAGQCVTMSASIGITLAPRDGTTAEELVKRADIAQYRAKDDGTGSIRFFTPAMEDALRRKQQLKAGLQTALALQEMELHFQPLVALRSGQATCFEALLRWHHPILGSVSPADFIPVAEETGLIVPMGEWALRVACREAASWPLPIRVAVNLSPVQFRSPGLLRAVQHALEQSGLPAERLELEITESVLMQDDEANLAILHQLRALGVRIALDDFGTGYSSLGYLLRFPFDKIKIDRSFITGLPDKEQSKAIVRAIIGLGQTLGITIVAEGVENPGQANALCSKGCQEAQGYLFSRPVPPQEVVGTIARLRRQDNMTF
jgi:diguanylate cyclase (GGDEF)-like protein/PAS domain S-box-containing protein